MLLFSCLLNQKRFIRKYKESNRKFPGSNVSLVHPFLHRSLPPATLPPSFILPSLSSPLLSFNFCSPFPVKITGLFITFFSCILSESLVFLLETMFHSLRRPCWPQTCYSPVAACLWRYICYTIHGSYF